MKRLGHLPTLRMFGRFRFLPTDGLIVPRHALDIHTGDDLAVIVLVLLKSTLHYSKHLPHYRDGIEPYAQARLPWFPEQPSCRFPYIHCIVCGTCSQREDLQGKEYCLRG